MLYQEKSCTKVSWTPLLCIVCNLLSFYRLCFSPGYPSQKRYQCCPEPFLPQLCSVILFSGSSSSSKELKPTSSIGGCWTQAPRFLRSTSPRGRGVLSWTRPPAARGYSPRSRERGEEGGGPTSGRRKETRPREDEAI